MKRCMICPRRCGADRGAGEIGVCGEDSRIFAARAALHFWEEPCISGERGSGAVFFSGCPLRCVYCQNYEIAAARQGMEISEPRLAEIFLELQEQGAENINLVTPTHYTEQIIRALKRAAADGLALPVVYNCSGYERAETLRSLEGIVSVYLTDFKYMSADTAMRYSHAPDYPETAKAALAEMVRQRPNPEFDANGRMTGGVIVRHLLLPGHVREAEEIVRYVYGAYKNQVYLSLMNQYTPFARLAELCPELNRRVTKREYERLIDYTLALGVEQAFIQEGATARESFIPAFDFEGL